MNKALAYVTFTSLLIAHTVTEASAARLTPPPATVCFQLEANATAVTKEPQLLCIDPIAVPASNDGHGISKVQYNYRMRLLAGAGTEVATFTLQLQSNLGGADRNKSVFVVANPASTVFNRLSFVFNGKRNATTGIEAGTVKIGDTKFFYHSVK